jgi:hypothetical protein
LVRGWRYTVVTAGRWGYTVVTRLVQRDAARVCVLVI